MAAAAAAWELVPVAGGATLRITGDWRAAAGVPPGAALLAAIDAASPPAIGIDCSGLGAWDSVLVATLRAVRSHCLARGTAFDPLGAPESARRLLALADAVPPHVRPEPVRLPLRALLNPLVPLRALGHGLRDASRFTGEVVIALARLATGRAETRLADVLACVQQAGPRALGIVTLISVLVGMILAYLGSVQLQQLGAQVYVAHLVGLGMVREMGALMTGVIMAGRTGAAYAAELGTMQTRDEIDAIETLGIPPMEFLVLPRLLALVLVMPLLTLYSNVLGMAGGAVVALAMDVTSGQYIAGLQEALTVTHVLAGLAKSVVFGLLIAACGCRAGILCGRSSEAVGQATTSAVVHAIVWLVVADAAFNIVYQRLGI